MKKYSVLGIISITMTALGFIIFFGNNVSYLILKDKLSEGNWYKSIEDTAILYISLGFIIAIISLFLKKMKKTYPIISFCLIIVLIGSSYLFKYLGREPTTEVKIEKITKQIKQNPTNDSLYLERATLYNSILSSDHDSLVDLDLAKAYSLGCRSENFYLLRAVNNMRPGKYEQSVADNSVLIDRYNRIKSYWLRGFSYMHLRKYENAINDFSEMMKFDPSKDHYFDISLCYKLLGKYQKAIEYLQKSPDKEPSLGKILAVSDCLILLGNYNEVVHILNNAMQHNGENIQVYQNRGMSYYKLKKYDKAVDDLKNLLKLDTRSYIPEYFLSVVYAAKRDKQNAIDHLNRAYKKGFGFTDILTKNVEFQKYNQDPQFIKICSDYSKNSDTTNYYLNQAITRDYVTFNKDYDVISNRINILLFEEDKRDEYNKLSQLIIIHKF